MEKLKNNSFFNNNLFKLWSFIERKRKIYFLLLLFLMVISVFAEILSLGSIIPFITILTDPNRLYNLYLVSEFINIFNIEQDQLLIIFTIFFCSTVIIAGLIRFFLLYLSVTLVYLVGSDLSHQIFVKTLNQSYETHLGRNSSDVLNSIVVNVNRVIGSVLMPSVNLLSSIILVIGIFFFLIALSPIITISVYITFICSYLLIIKITKHRIESNSAILAKQSPIVVKSIQEGIGSIRDIIIDNNHSFYSDLYKKSDISVRKAAGSNAFIANSPRLLIETIALIFMAIVAYVISQTNQGFLSMLPYFAVLALAAMRLMPMVQQTYASITSIKGMKQVLENVIVFLEQNVNYENSQSTDTEINFKKNICLQDISFCYEGSSNNILQNLNLNIMKGTSIGIIGGTGIGKSSLLDLMMGLILPTNGNMLIDNICVNQKNRFLWQKNITHVPQSIFLADLSIEENIAFGIPKDKIDSDLVIECAKSAQIHHEILNIKNKYKAQIGERGAKLSGGQIQRIGIARALYKKPSVLFLDEATSALDDKTEGNVINALNSLKTITIVLVAHRISSLKFCNEIYEIKDKKLVSLGNYKNLKEV